jgi:hypothetical protein
VQRLATALMRREPTLRRQERELEDEEACRRQLRRILLTQIGSGTLPLTTAMVEELVVSKIAAPAARLADRGLTVERRTSVRNRRSVCTV